MEIKYWNGYSWRVHRPGFYGIDRSVASESVLDRAPSMSIAEAIRLGAEVMMRSGGLRPAAFRITTSDACLDENGSPTHPGEPCVIGGPQGNHAW